MSPRPSPLALVARTGVAACALAVAACSPSPDAPGPGAPPADVVPPADATPAPPRPAPPPVSDGPFASEADYRQQRAQAVEALNAAASTGAASPDACRALLYGEQACGGPTDWVVLSAETSDTTRVRRLAEQVTALDARANAQFNLVSTCMALMAPPVALRGGQCVSEGDEVEAY